MVIWNNKNFAYFCIIPNGYARMAELVDALVSNTSGKPCRFDSGSGY